MRLCWQSAAAKRQDTVSIRATFAFTEKDMSPHTCHFVYPFSPMGALLSLGRPLFGELS